MHSPKFIFKFIAVTFVLSLACIKYITIYGPSQILWTSQQQKHSLDPRPPDGVIPADPGSGVRVILLWYPHANYYGMGEGDTGFRTCDVTCFLTRERSQLSSADAVLFRASSRTPELPRRASQRQIHVFMEWESPLNIGTFKLRNLSGLFNLTMTYRRDTDVYVPYGEVVPSTVPDLAPSGEELAEKSELAVWLVSNCHPSSARVEYGARLAQYLPIHVYGYCGNDSCRKDNITCLRRLSRRYLFMLAFENSYCPDYVTEKLFRALSMTLVPVVLGGAEYSNILPPRSYIDVRDFDSPRHLARYLSYLHQNRTAYAEYFSWRVNYTVLSSAATRPRAFCRLCQILHNLTYPYQTNMDPSVYWSRKRCLTGEEERQQLHLLDS